MKGSELMAIKFDFDKDANEIYTDYITQNPSFKNNTIKIDGIVWHDVAVGTITKKAADWQARWDRSASENSVHAIVAYDKTCIMMPCMEKVGYAKRCWGCGSGKKGSFNSSRVQFEQVCPSAVKYAGAGFTVLDKSKAIEQQTKIFAKSIDFCARLCLYHGLNPLGKDKYGLPVIMCHQEACQAGFAGNHADILEIFRYLPELELNMDKLRQLVKERMEEIELEEFIMSLNKQEVFDQYMADWMVRQNKKPADKWAEADLAWAKKEGLLAGDNSGNLMPRGNLDRQSFVAVLHRFYEKFVEKK